MNKLFKNKRIWYLAIVLLMMVVMVGCAKIYDDNHQILPEKIISLSTTFKYMFDNEGWFQAIFVWPVAQMINYLTPYAGILGSIALVTVGINVLTFGLTVKSTVSSQKMQMIQPEAKKIQEKYKDKKDQKSQMQMANELNALYAKYKINPIGSLVTPFMQLPILIAMYQAVQRSESVVTGKFMGVELTNTPQYGFQNGVYVLVVIFVLMAVSQFLSMQIPQYLTKRRAEKNRTRRHGDDQEGNPANTMMYGMLLMIVFIGFTWPAAMSLYWTVTSIVNIVKTVFIQWRYIDNEKV